MGDMANYSFNGFAASMHFPVDCSGGEGDLKNRPVLIDAAQYFRVGAAGERRRTRCPEPTRSYRPFPDLELRSVRRGGLQLMATLGFPWETILSFSKHGSTAMLMKYLDKGAVSLNQAQLQASTTNQK